MRPEPSLRLAYDAVDDVEAIKGWNVRVHGHFWVCGMDEEGTFLVPDSNRDMVYQCLGAKDAIYPKVERDFPRPVQMSITMIPWYGRLVYDGVMMPPLGHMRPPMASVKLALDLAESVAKARREGRVISRLAQLEVEGGSHAGLHDSGDNVDDSNEDSVEQAKPTSEESSLVKKLSKFPRSAGPPTNNPDADMAPGSYWVFRRCGYTEHENPNHVGLVMTGPSVLAQFTCSALTPTSVDILQSLVSTTRQVGKRPLMVGIDYKKCCDRVTFLLQELDGIEVFYYPPATAEETAAASWL
jgi:hypothetical protein